MKTALTHKEDKVLNPIIQKIVDYTQLGKFRLSLSVVFSAGMAYLIGSEIPADWYTFLAMMLGGLLVTLSANASNEIIERRYDAQMKRTASRPLAANRMPIWEAVVYVILTGIAGVILLTYGANLLSGLIGLASFLLYAFVYTPLKRLGSIAVIVGAIPGALPMVIGWTAARNHVDGTALALFAVQFCWQLPHFWAIAWLADEDYRKAGYYLLPFNGQRNRKSALWILAATALMMPVGLLPQYIGEQSIAVSYVLFSLGLLFFIQALQLSIDLSRKSALRLMFGSFAYLPLALITILFEKHLMT